MHEYTNLDVHCQRLKATGQVTDVPFELSQCLDGLLQDLDDFLQAHFTQVQVSEPGEGVQKVPENISNLVCENC